MNISKDDSVDLIFEKGSLHDCQISDITWSFEMSRMEIFITDLNANFVGLPEYRGAQFGRLVLYGIMEIDFDVVVAGKKLRIYEVSVKADDKEKIIEILFSPSGKLAARSIELNLEAVA